MRIAILPTGRMEWEALPQALQSLFPQHEFYSLQTKEEVKSNKITDSFTSYSFTSCNVETLLDKNKPNNQTIHGEIKQSNNAYKLIERAAAEAIGDKKGKREVADLVLIIDDIELVNLHQPEKVVKVVREAAKRFLDTFLYERIRQDRYTQALKNKVSFHLAKPMIESWLFADMEGLIKACNPTRKANLLWGIDPECFLTNDPSYEMDNGEQCNWHNLSNREKSTKKKTYQPEWLKVGIQREIHPKAYLSWLCFNASEKKCSSYSESGCGVTALQNLNWAMLFQNINHACFARSMIFDIATVLEVNNPFPGITAPETALLDQNRILRNV